MMKKNLKVAVMAVFVFVTGLNLYKAQTDVKLSDAQLKNVEALATGEGVCVEWVDKNCYDENDFSKTLSANFYAICAGEVTVPGGKTECGNFSIYEPNVPWRNSVCLYCVRRQ